MNNDKSYKRFSQSYGPYHCDKCNHEVAKSSTTLYQGLRLCIICLSGIKAKGFQQLDLFKDYDETRNEG